jgi:hypothetical protein
MAPRRGVGLPVRRAIGTVHRTPLPVHRVVRTAKRASRYAPPDGLHHAPRA